MATPKPGKEESNPSGLSSPSIPVPTLTFTAKQFWIALSTIVGLILSAMGALSFWYIEIMTSVKKIESAVESYEKIQDTNNAAIETKINSTVTIMEDNLKNKEKQIDNLEKRIEKLEEKTYK